MATEKAPEILYPTPRVKREKPKLGDVYQIMTEDLRLTRCSVVSIIDNSGGGRWRAFVLDGKGAVRHFDESGGDGDFTDLSLQTFAPDGYTPWSLPKMKAEDKERPVSHWCKPGCDWDGVKGEFVPKAVKAEVKTEVKTEAKPTITK